MTDELRALADEWARDLIDRRGLALLDVERFAASRMLTNVKVRAAIADGEAEAAKRKGEGKR